MNGDGRVCKTAISLRPPKPPDLLTTSWPRIKAAAAPVVEAVNESFPGDYVEVSIP